MTETTREWNAAGDGVDWANIKAEVVEKIEAVRLAWKASEAGPPELHAKLVSDIYGPMMECIATFCASVEIGLEPEHGN